MHIDKVETTDDTLTSRGGISFFVRYLERIGIYHLLSKYFGDLRKSTKGLPISDLFKQILCFFLDGNCRHLTYFDDLKQDEGYARSIEQKPKKMASSHAVKRFCKSFCIFKVFLFRKVLQKLFIWRLNLARPEVIYLDLDAMVMDNDDAPGRHGVGQTYKKVKGFAPLFITWGPFIIDAVFRGGIRHSNHEDTAIKAVEHIVNLIRREYRPDVMIVLTNDTGFFDQKNFKKYEDLGIIYICGARITADIKKIVADLPKSKFRILKKDDQSWEFASFNYAYGTWAEPRKFVYCRPMYRNDQMLLPFDRKQTLIVTNISPETITPDMPDEIRMLADDANIVAHYHRRGAFELVLRAFKDFGFEELPFKRFSPNAAFFYMMITAFFVYEAFKQDVLSQVFPAVSYAQTIRRKFLDIAGKIVRHAGIVTLKFGQAVLNTLGKGRDLLIRTRTTGLRAFADLP